MPQFFAHKLPVVLLSFSDRPAPHDHFLFRKLTLMVFLHHKWCCLNAHEIMCYFNLQGYNQFVDLGCAYISLPSNFKVSKRFCDGLSFMFMSRKLSSKNY